MKLSEEQCVAVGSEIFDLSMESSIEKLSRIDYGYREKCFVVAATLMMDREQRNDKTIAKVLKEEGYSTSFDDEFLKDVVKMALITAVKGLLVEKKWGIL